MRKIILDTDIGDDIDDALALALALQSDDIELLGIVTTYRNSVMRAKIAMALLDGWNRMDIPVHCGLDDPEVEPYHNFSYEKMDENGKPIIGHYEEYMEKYIPQPQSGITYMAETIRKYPNEITLVAIGPLTNVEALHREYPKEFAQLKEIVIMGGRFFDEIAEWNIKCDPEAANNVFRSGAVIRLVPLDVTLQCVLNEEQLTQLASIQESGNQRLFKMIEIWMKNGKGKKPILHDPLALACVTKEYCRFMSKKVRIGLNNKERGRTIVDSIGSDILVADEVKNIEFTQYMCDKICE